MAALSCNVGDKVYENYHGRIFEYAVTSIEILSSYKILYKVQSTEPWNHWVRFIGFNKYDIGKTIFLNREDAEKALKGGEEEGRILRKSKACPLKKWHRFFGLWWMITKRTKSLVMVV